MAKCDAKYHFTFINIGNYGIENDAQIFNNSDFGKAIVGDEMSIPYLKVVNGHELLFVMVSGEIFALKTWLIKLFPWRTLSKS